jgi:hypothetical protein
MKRLNESWKVCSKLLVRCSLSGLTVRMSRAPRPHDRTESGATAPFGCYTAVRMGDVREAITLRHRQQSQLPDKRELISVVVDTLHNFLERAARRSSKGHATVLDMLVVGWKVVIFLKATS